MSNEKMGYRAGMIISIIVAIVFVVAGIVVGDFGIVTGLVLAYLSLSFGVQLGHDTVVDDMFFWAWTHTIDMPGIIFELDMDGILFFIAYKLIIAPIATLLIMLALGIFGTICAILVSAVTFPFTVFRIVKETI